MAEAIFKQHICEKGLEDSFEISSVGTKDWDVGLPPDLRARKQLAEHGYFLDPNKRARQITSEEIQEADFLIAMTSRVANELGNGENVHLLMSFVPDEKSLDIPDPYPSNTFPQAFRKIERGIKAFITYLETGNPQS
jgi:protein-tyrosine phosphatase